MANRKIHLIVATLFWGAFIGVFYAVALNTAFINLGTLDILKYNSLWIVLSFIACHFGAQLPDYDLLWDKLLPHRNVITHSLLLPLIISLPIFFVYEHPEFIFLVPIYAFYQIGHGSHLIADLWPEEWKGPALVHIFWINEDGKKTMSPKASRLFLLINGIIILAAGIILLYFFQRWI